MNGTIGKIAVGALVPIAVVDALLIIALLISEQRWSAWQEVVGSIVGFSLILMLAPAVLISIAAEMVLNTGIRSKWFLLLGGFAGTAAGIGLSTISKFSIAIMAFYALLGVTGGVTGAYGMQFMRSKEAANKKLQPIANAPAE